MDARQFHIGDILSITTGMLVSPRLIAGVYDILNHMTGENLFTHQLPRACEICKPELLKQHPQLADVAASEITQKNFTAWVNERIKQFGETLPVMPLPAGKYEVKDAFSELAEMAPNANVIAVKL